MSAIISPCERYRYRLERDIQSTGPVVLLVGVNPSTADATNNDPTIRKELGFGQRLGWRKIIKGNVFAYRATDVGELAHAPDPIGPDNIEHLIAMVADADLIIPCWGNRLKIPSRLRHHLDATAKFLRQADHPLSPVRIFGLTQTGDPMHPLMLAYKTPLVAWNVP